MEAAKTTADVLREARGLISDPAHWTQGTFAEAGVEKGWVAIHSPAAIAWCLEGACYRAAGAGADKDAWAALNVLDRIAGGSGTAAYLNDHSSHAEVLEAFDKAIALAEAEDS